MQVGDQQRLACGPEQRALAHDQQILARERKGNHAPAYAAPRVAASPINRAAWLRRPAHRLRQAACPRSLPAARSDEHTSELQSLMRISYADFCLKQTNITSI